MLSAANLFAATESMIMPVLFGYTNNHSLINIQQLITLDIHTKAAVAAESACIAAVHVLSQINFFTPMMRGKLLGMHALGYACSSTYCLSSF